MKFGHKLLSSQHPPWSENYINYLRLKELLSHIFDLETSPEDGGYIGNLQAGGSISRYDGISTFHQGALPVASSHSFQKELNSEIQKALLFLMKSIGELASNLSGLSDQRRFISVNVQSLLEESKEVIDIGQQQNQKLQQRKQEIRIVIQEQLQDIDNLRMEYLVRVGSQLLLLLEFVELNIEAIVKIVKKHDKLLSRWEESGSRSHHTIEEDYRYSRLRRQYLPRFAVYSSDPNVRGLFLAAVDAGNCSNVMSGGTLQLSKANQNQSDGNSGAWDVIQWNLEVALKELFHWEKVLREVIKDCGADKREDPVTTKLDSFIPISSRSLSEIPQISDNETPFKRFFSQSSSFLQGLHYRKKDEASFFEPIIYQIQSSRRRLGQMHHRYIRMVYAHEMLHLIDDKNIHQEDEKCIEHIRKRSIEGENDGMEWKDLYPTVSTMSKFLNLASAGLYMCNYNIVAPTSGLYAKHLGFDPANAGIIIGMTPTAVIMSSVLYSWWSSYSYKRALMFASFCCIVGNVVYALAMPCNSLTMVLLGRLLTGFGSARTINRRYIADYYSIENRTSGMASFVSASALGMALGPGLAASLSFVTPAEISDTNSFWTVETAPGYLMFVLWAIYLFCNMMFFEEPDRVGHPSTNSSSSPRAQPTGDGPQDKSTIALVTESTPLLNAPNSGACTKNVQPVYPLLKSCGNIPVFISLALLVLLKSVLEGISSSAPTVSEFYFGWGVHASGLYLAMLASFVIPTNHVVAHISRRFDDRELIFGTLMVILAGILGFLVYSEDGNEYSETRFILFGLVAFVACNALEGPTLGLLSKTIPKSLARGILNAGLLATEAGTIGRVIGDFWLSSAAFHGLNHMVNRTFEPMCVMVGVLMFATLWSYRHLQPRFEDEDDD